MPANRTILSTRSQALETLLMGDFEESKIDEVRMRYPSAVIRALVHFCSTDELEDIKGLGGEDVSNIHRARLAAELCTAADFYQLKGLQDKAISKTEKWLRPVVTNEGIGSPILTQRRGQCM